MPGFRSLCKITCCLSSRFEWHSLRARSTCMKIFQMTSSATKSFSARHFLISYAMSPFSQYSITMKSFFFSLSMILWRTAKCESKRVGGRDLLVVILHDVRMLQFVESVHLGDELLLFPLLHPAVVQFFPAEDLTVWLSFDLKNRAKTTCRKNNTRVLVITGFQNDLTMVSVLDKSRMDVRRWQLTFSNFLETLVLLHAWLALRSR